MLLILVSCGTDDESIPLGEEGSFTESVRLPTPQEIRNGEVAGAGYLVSFKREDSQGGNIVNRLFKANSFAKLYQQTQSNPGIQDVKLLAHLNLSRPGQSFLGEKSSWGPHQLNYLKSSRSFSSTDDIAAITKVSFPVMRKPNSR